MKVLFFITSLSINSGGPSRSVPLMAKGLSEAGVDVTLLVLYSEDMNIHTLEGTTVRVLPIVGGFDYKKIERYVITEAFDIVQLQSIWDFEYHLIVRICIKHHIPYVITPRGMLEPWSLGQKKWKKKLALLLYQNRDLNNASCIYTTSEMEAKNILKMGIASPCAVIPNGIETDDYPCRQSLSNVTKQVLFLSRIHKKKGVELLIDAWHSLHKDFPEWVLRIVGNGEVGYIKTLRARIDAGNGAGSIILSQPVFGKEKIDLYQSSALFVLPSYSENFGMVIAEAMSCGVPVITTENTPWGFLNETNSGWSIPLSLERLVKTLYEALKCNSSVLYEKGQCAGEVVREMFNYKMTSRKAIGLYKWILGDDKEPSFIMKK